MKYSDFGRFLAFIFVVALSIICLIGCNSTPEITEPTDAPTGPTDAPTEPANPTTPHIHIPADDDGDCMTYILCEECGKVVVPGQKHVAGEDDGDCSTPVMCVNCDQVAIEADHDFGFNEPTCVACGTVNPDYKFKKIDTSCFVGSNYQFIMSPNETINGKNYECILADTNVTGATFSFTPWAVSCIKEYAKDNNYDTLRILTCASITDNYVHVNGVRVDSKAWYEVEIPIAELSAETLCKSFSSKHAGVFMCFEFINSSQIDIADPTWVKIDETNFIGEGITFKATSNETIDGKDYECILADTDVADAAFSFAPWAVKGMQEYAKVNGFLALRIIACCTTTFESITINGCSFTSDDGWYIIEIPVTDLSDTIVFQTEGEGWLFMCFEFHK